MKFSYKMFIALSACVLAGIFIVNLKRQKENLSTNPEQKRLIASDIISFVLEQKEKWYKRLPAEPNQSEISLPYDHYIIRQMAEWKFKYFVIALEYLENGSMNVTLNKQNFSYEDFQLICDAMGGTKKDWTTEELIELLRIGNQFLADGEGEYKIVYIVSMAIFEKRFDEERITAFSHLKASIFRAVYMLRHPAVSMANENEFLQLDGDKIPENGMEKIMKCFILVAKSFKYASVINLKFIDRILKEIREQLKNVSFVFYMNSESAIICSGKDFEIVYKKFSHLKYLWFTIVDSENISSSIRTIKARRLSNLDIANSKMEILSLDLDEILSKIKDPKNLKIGGDFDIKSFKEFYFKMKDAILKDEVYHSSGDSNYLNFYISLENPVYYGSLLKEKERDSWDIWEKGEKFFLDLTKSSSHIAELESTNFSSKTFTCLNGYIDDSEYLGLLNNVFNNDKLTIIKLFFKPKFNQFSKLAEILGGKSFLSLTLETSNIGDENEQNIIVSLSEASFWDKLEHLHFINVSLQAILIGLEYLPRNLRMLEFTLKQPSDRKIAKIVSNLKKNELKNMYVEELKIHYSNNDDYTDDFEQLPLLFPNLRKLIIYGMQHLKPFKIKNDLNGLEIICGSLENENEFINELMNSPTLTSVYVSFGRRFIKWKKEDRIYAQFNVQSKDQRTQTE